MKSFMPLLYNAIKAYIVHNDIPKGVPTKEILDARYKESKDIYWAKIMEVVTKDVEVASFGIPTKKPTALQVTAGNISLTHGITMFAKYLVTGEETINQIK